MDYFRIAGHPGETSKSAACEPMDSSLRVSAVHTNHLA
jgi:hypothetical protein